jgi:hypothetical protein
MGFAAAKLRRTLPAQNDHAENKNCQRTCDCTDHQGSTHGFLLSRRLP